MREHRLWLAHAGGFLPCWKCECGEVFYRQRRGEAALTLAPPDCVRESFAAHLERHA